MPCPNRATFHLAPTITGAVSARRKPRAGAPSPGRVRRTAGTLGADGSSHPELPHRGPPEPGPRDERPPPLAEAQEPLAVLHPRPERVGVLPLELRAPRLRGRGPR